VGKRPRQVCGREGQPYSPLKNTSASAYWETASIDAGQTEPERDFARIWRAAEKIVYSRTLPAPTTVRTRLEQVREGPAQTAQRRSEQRQRTQFAKIGMGFHYPSCALADAAQQGQYRADGVAAQVLVIGDDVLGRTGEHDVQPERLDPGDVLGEPEQVCAGLHQRASRVVLAQTDAARPPADSRCLHTSDARWHPRSAGTE
jgi:hypothetical protein